jgi:hypothetical protein
MGSYDSTCAASNIVIGYDDPIVAFVITANTKAYNYKEAHLIYPWDKYSIVSFPLYGKYDDYGSIELNKNENTLALSMLQNLFPDSKLIKDRSLNHNFIREPQQAYDDQKYYLGLIMVHREVYDNLMASYKHIDGYEDRIKYMIEDITTKYPHDLKDYISADKENKSPKEMEERMKSYMGREVLRKAAHFGADHFEIRQYGKDEDANYDDPNPLAPLSMCGSREFAVHSLITFWYISNGPDILELNDEFHEQFKAFAEICALGNALFDLGRTIIPTLNRRQETELKPAIKFEYENLLYMFNEESSKAYEYRGGERDIDDLIAGLNTFHDKALTKLMKWKKKCEKGIDQD